MINVLKHKGKRTIGQGLVELALTLPIFLLVVYGIFELGRAIFMYSAVLNASRDAARYAAAADGVQANDTAYLEVYKDCDGIRDRAKTVSSFVDLSANDAILISYLRYDPLTDTDEPIESCEVLNSTGETLTHGSRVEVTVTSMFNPIVPLVNFGIIPISSTTTRSIVTGVNIWDDGSG